MFCANCGRELSTEDKFCRFCGRSTGPSVASPVSTPTVTSQVTVGNPYRGKTAKTCTCGRAIAESAESCPHCGRRFTPWHVWAFGIGLPLLFILVLAYSCNQACNAPDTTRQYIQGMDRARGELPPQPAAMTPAEARAAQKAMLDTAEVYRKTIAFTQEAEAENLSGICASISEVKASARQALSSVRRVPTAQATRPMIETLRSGLLDIQSGAQSIQSACESGVPVQDEPMAKMVRGMRAINAFTTDKASLPTAPK